MAWPSRGDQGRARPRSNGHKWALAPLVSLCQFQLRQQKTPSSGALLERMMGLEPTTFCMAAHVAEDARRDMRELAAQHDRSLAAEIRQAISEHIERDHHAERSAQ